MRFKLLMLTLGLALFGLIAGPVQGHSYALFNNSKNTACRAIADNQDCAKAVGGSNNTVNHAIAAAVNVLSFIAGVAAVIIIIIAGIKYITANGDSGQISSAKNTIIYALVGLVVATLAQVIVRFVFNKI